MGTIRDRERTRKCILREAKAVFAEKGYEAASVSEVARRAGLSKQLIHHHFGSKEALFQQVHASEFRPEQWEENVSDDPADMIAERFIQRAQDPDYTRFLTWEAASARSDVPGRAARQRRLESTAALLRRLQDEGVLASRFDARLVQLAIVALSTYPLAFSQNTRLVTGHRPTDAAFQREWAGFLRDIGRMIFSAGARSGPAVAVTRKARKKR